MTKPTDLIKRLEAAPEGSRMLDEMVAESMGWTRDQEDIQGQQLWLEPGSGCTTYLPHYTTSIDAALTLVPTGEHKNDHPALDTWCWELQSGRNCEQSVARVWIGDGWDDIYDDTVLGTYAIASHPALALTIACLKARDND